MFKTIKNAWKIPELRKKMLFTVLVIIVFRLGAVIPVPFLDAAQLKAVMDSVAGTGSGTALGYLDMLSGGAFSQATLFAMSVTPYINSQIIIQLLTIAIPALERMAKEGEEGRKRLETIVRYLAVILGLIQGLAYYMFLRNSGNGGSIVKYTQGGTGIFVGFVIVLCFTAGTALMMWMGEQINQFGVGNGISILLFAGIVARLPHTINTLGQYLSIASEDPTNSGKYFFTVPLFVVLFLGVIWLISFMNESERRIPIQYAKRVVGRKQYGGQSSHLPIKVGLGGVMPIIFASVILSIPSTIQLFMGSNATGFWASFVSAFRSTGLLYCVLYFLLIMLFGFFYTAMQYNPIEMANNLRQNNGTIPGIRPGKPTSDYISRILSKITMIGSLYLSIIALLPIIFGNVAGMQNLSMGGTSIIIMVGVALETVKQLESQMMMRHYKGFLD
ncbi:preprotein translocase subunit SecY [Caproicibacterium sp. BJN0003]|uniref:preprotein translocase subunit SecY n=1 Tax=Caproicibacterium sp. BJN0003 TaxID=2994078 RepID=UPI002259804E|nr:preprotein translocase subunit SecY [Caproicibacterium sp. BJN0003]UZT81813.1 preprotein translocase subunit SecY [Caproicibacterium sp. BJN0003]